MNKGILITGALALGLVFAGCSPCSAGGFGNYSSGYRMGQLTKFSIKGMMFKSGEGQMLMGSESTPYVITDGDGNRKTINPWYFSASNPTIQNGLNTQIGEYVVLDYNESHIKSPKVDTAYEITKISKIQAPRDKACSASNFTDGSKGGGTRVGRIVKASKKGLVADSFEIMFQQGNSGAQFKNMSISEDENFYNCAVSFLKAGQRVKITYDESHMNLNVFGRNTRYDIVKIEPIKKASQALN